MKTKRILTLLAALMVSVLLTAQTNDRRSEITKKGPEKQRLEMMNFSVMPGSVMYYNSIDPGNELSRCYKKQQIELPYNLDPRHDYQICYPINTRPVIREGIKMDENIKGTSGNR
jgi:hypothetical protein